MEKVYIQLEENKCELPDCDCGWNIKIGGYSEEALFELKKFIHNKNTRHEDIEFIRRNRGK